MRDPLRSAGPLRLLAVAAVASLAAFGLWWVLTTPLSGDAPEAERSGSGDAFYQLGEPTEGLAVGQVAPELAGEPGTDRVVVDLEGREVTLGSLRGRPVWVVFWATWCPPCQAETPDLQRAYEAHASDGLALIAIDVQEPAEVVADYVEKYSLTYTAALDPTGEIMRRYGVFGLPTHYFIDGEAVIRERVYGPMSADQIEQRLASIIGG